MARPATRIRVLEVVLGLALLTVLGRAAQLQLVEGGRWAGEASRTRTARETVPARRGAIRDRTGAALAVTQEFYHVGIAPGEVTDRHGLVRTASRALAVPASRLDRALRGRDYVYHHGPYTAAQVEPLRAFRGVHLETEFNRFYPSGALARSIVGSLDPDGGHGASGLESSLDSLLTGKPGERIMLKDAAGRRYESPGRRIREPVPGHDVTLTIDHELQEIAEAGLEDAIVALGADGGDAVFYDPWTGEVLAIASRQRSGGRFTARPTALTSPFEPGSTAKLFTAAALLVAGRVRDRDSVYAENGEWIVPVGTRGTTRRLTDTHPTRGWLTLARAIEVSSNIAMAKFSERLRPEEQYETLRNFGFGSPTGVEFPSESRGVFRAPHEWIAGYTRASLAIGYELSVTPLQLAAAYGAIANDGILLSPTLVREVRAPSGEVRYRHQPEPVRRAVPPELAARLRDFLRGAVGEGGTGEQAQMANYTLLGKTGTSRRFGEGGYTRNGYNASFAALFPADQPQLVVIVKIENPQGDYYGGQVAAPLTRRMLQQALASRQVAIDRNRFSRAETVPAAVPAPAPAEAREVVAVPWPWRPDSMPALRRAVPAVEGLPVRRAVASLHGRGFRVVLHGTGSVARTWPAAGDSLAAGSAVTVWTE